MQTEMLVQVDLTGTAAAILEEGKLVEFYLESTTERHFVGNIYRGRVENVLPGMQAAFVNIGLKKNAFLYVQDALPRNNRSGSSGTVKIRDVLREGQEITVQVTRDPIATKGPRVTTRVVLPGRYCVLVPEAGNVGISRKITDEKERDRLHKIALQLKPPGSGLIIRTVAGGIAPEKLQEDVALLSTLWMRISARAAMRPSPELIHRDLGLIPRLLRDFFSDAVAHIDVNNSEAYRQIMEIMELLYPQYCPRVRLLEGKDLFEQYGVTIQVDQALNRRVWLKCGGYIVIDRAEALTVVDVNTGKFIGKTDLEGTVLRTNMEAVVEIARQLRLRDIGGIIIIDFIGMDNSGHRDMILYALAEELRKDRTKTNVLGLTPLGLVEVTRKKTQPDLESVMQKKCPCCEGTGKVLVDKATVLKLKREVSTLANATATPGILIEAHPAIVALLEEKEGEQLRFLETKTKKSLVLKTKETLHPWETVITPLNQAASPVLPTEKN